MKFQYFSDLHSEYNGNLFEKLPAEKLLKKDEGIIILAGDIYVREKFHRVARSVRKTPWHYLTKNHHDVIYVPGNHEFYYSNIESMKQVIKNHNKVYEYPDVIVITTPLWSWLDRETSAAVDGWPDFTLIKGNTFATHNEIHISCLEWLRQQFAKYANDPRKKIIVSHFTPSYQSIHPRWNGKASNKYFSNNLDDLILEYQPDVWVHGHTHDAFDYMIGKTRILCNPHGYPGEKKIGKLHFDVVEI